MRSTALLPVRRKSCYRFLSPVKIYRSRPGFNPRTLGPMASTITITSSRRAKNRTVKARRCSEVFVPGLRIQCFWRLFKNIVSYSVPAISILLHHSGIFYLEPLLTYTQTFAALLPKKKRSMLSY
jgi:hypothetical protein